MPRNVRNCWLTASVDGRESDIATGPRNGNGGLRARLQIREKRAISDKALSIEVYRNGPSNKLKVVWDGQVVVDATLER